MPGDGKYISGDELYKKVSSNTTGLTPEKFKEDMSNPQNQYRLFSNLRDANDKSTPSDYGEFRKQYGFDKLPPPSKTTTQPSGADDTFKNAYDSYQNQIKAEDIKKDNFNKAMLSTGHFVQDKNGQLSPKDPDKPTPTREQQRLSADAYFDKYLSPQEKKAQPYVDAYYNAKTPYEKNQLLEKIKGTIQPPGSTEPFKMIPEAQYRQLQAGKVNMYLQDLQAKTKQDSLFGSAANKMRNLSGEFTPEEEGAIKQHGASEENQERDASMFAQMAYTGKDVNGDPSFMTRVTEQTTKGLLDFASLGNYSMPTEDEYNQRAADILKRNGIQPQTQEQAEAFNPTTADAIADAMGQGVGMLLPMMVGGWVGGMAKLPELTAALGKSPNKIIGFAGKLLGKSIENAVPLQMSNWHQSLINAGGTAAGFTAGDMLLNRLGLKAISPVGKVIMGMFRGGITGAGMTVATPAFMAAKDAILNDDNFVKQFGKYSPPTKDYIATTISMSLLGGMGGAPDAKAKEDAQKEMRANGDAALSDNTDEVQTNAINSVPKVDGAAKDLVKEQPNPQSAPKAVQEMHPITVSDDREFINHGSREVSDIEQKKPSTDKAFIRDYGSKDDEEVQSMKKDAMKKGLVTKTIQLKNKDGVVTGTRLIVTDMNHEHLGQRMYDLSIKELGGKITPEETHELVALSGGDVVKRLQGMATKAKNEGVKEQYKGIIQNIKDKTQGGNGAKNEVADLLQKSDELSKSNNLTDREQAFKFRQEAEVTAKKYGFKTHWEGNDLQVETPEGEKVTTDKAVKNENAEPLVKAVQEGDATVAKAVAEKEGLNVITKPSETLEGKESELTGQPKENIEVMDGDKTFMKTEFLTINDEAKTDDEADKLYQTIGNIGKINEDEKFSIGGLRDANEVSKGIKSVMDLPTIEQENLLKALRKNEIIVGDNKYTIDEFNELYNNKPHDIKNLMNRKVDSGIKVNSKEGETSFAALKRTHEESNYKQKTETIDDKDLEAVKALKAKGKAETPEEIELQKKYPKTLADKEPAQNKSEGEANTDVKNIPVKDIETDISEFQNREKEFAQSSVDEIKNEFAENPNTKLRNPIVLWKSPEGKNFVLSGHSRLEAFKQMGKEDIPATYYEGTKEQAKAFAQKSNLEGTPNSLLEKAKLYKADREAKMSKEKLGEKYKSDNKKVEAYSYLNPKGKTADAIRALTGKDLESSGNMDAIANWIGKARKDFPELSDTHENELYDYLTNKGGFEKNKSYLKFANELMTALTRKNMAGGVKPDEQIDIARAGQKGNLEQEFDAKKSELQKAVSNAKSERDLAQGRFAKSGLTKPEQDIKLKPYNDKVLNAVNDLAAHEKTYNATIEGQQQQTDLFAAGITGHSVMKALGLPHVQEIKELPSISQPYAKGFNDVKGHFTELYNKDLPIAEFTKGLSDKAEELRGQADMAKTKAEKLQHNTAAETLDMLSDAIHTPTDRAIYAKILDGQNSFTIAGKEYYGNTLKEMQAMRDFKRPSPPITKAQRTEALKKGIANLDHMMDAWEGRSEQEIKKGYMGVKGDDLVSKAYYKVRQVYKGLTRALYYKNHTMTFAEPEIREDLRKMDRNIDNMLVKNHYADQTANKGMTDFLKNAIKGQNNEKLLTALNEGEAQHKDWNTDELKKQGLSDNEITMYNAIRQHLKTGQEHYKESDKYANSFYDMRPEGQEKYLATHKTYIEGNQGYIPRQRGEGDYAVEGYGKNPDTGVEGRYFNKFKSQKEADAEVARLKSEGYTGVDYSKRSSKGFGGKAENEQPRAYVMKPKDEITHGEFKSLNEFEEALKKTDLNDNEKKEIMDAIHKGVPNEQGDIFMSDDERDNLNKKLEKLESDNSLREGIVQSIERLKKGSYNPHFMPRSTDVHGNIVHGYDSSMEGILTNIDQFNERAIHNKALNGADYIYNRDKGFMDKPRYMDTRKNYEEYMNKIRDNAHAPGSLQLLQQTGSLIMIAGKAKSIMTMMLHPIQTTYPEAGNEINIINKERAQQGLPAYKQWASVLGVKAVGQAANISKNLVLGVKLPKKVEKSSLGEAIKYCFSRGGGESAFNDYIEGREAGGNKSWRLKAFLTGFSDLSTRVHSIVVGHELGLAKGLQGQELNDYTEKFLDKTKFQWGRRQEPKAFSTFNVKPDDNAGQKIGKMLAGSVMRSGAMLRGFQLQDLGFMRDIEQRSENKAATTARLLVPRLLVGGGIAKGLAALGGVGVSGIENAIEAVFGQKTDEETRKILIGIFGQEHGNTLADIITYGSMSALTGRDLRGTMDGGALMQEGYPISDQLAGAGHSLMVSGGKIVNDLFHGNLSKAVQDVPGEGGDLAKSLHYYATMKRAKNNEMGEKTLYTGSGSNIVPTMYDVVSKGLGFNSIDWANYYNSMEFKNDLVGKTFTMAMPDPNSDVGKIQNDIKTEVTNAMDKGNIEKIMAYKYNPTDSTFKEAFGGGLLSRVKSYNADLFNNYYMALQSMKPQDFKDSLKTIDQVRKFAIGITSDDNVWKDVGDTDYVNNEFIDRAITSKIKGLAPQ